MISHIDGTIEQILREELPESDYQIDFDIPNKEWVSKISGTKPVINIYLYDIHENTQLRSNQWEIKKNKDGTYKKTPPDVRLDLYYVITVWSPATSEAVLEEHHIMSIIYSKLFEFTNIPRKYFQGDLKKVSPTPEIPITVASKDSFKEQGIGQFWSTLEQNWKPAVYLTVTVPVSIQKHIKGKLVSTKILEYGQIGHFTLLKIHPAIFKTKFRKDTTDIFKVELTNTGSFITKWIKAGSKSLTVNDIAQFTVGQKIIILDGDKTEFAEIKSVDSEENKIELKDKLTHSHSKVEVKVLGNENKLNINLLENLHDNQTSIYAEGEDVNKLKIGEILKLKDNSTEQYFLLTGILKEQIGLKNREEFFEFGGIITNNAPKPSPIIGAKVELLDLLDNKISEVLTDTEGKFVFYTKDKEPKKLRIEKEGYKEEEINIPEPYKLTEDKLFVQLKSI